MPSRGFSREPCDTPCSLQCRSHSSGKRPQRRPMSLVRVPHPLPLHPQLHDHARCDHHIGADATRPEQVRVVDRLPVIAAPSDVARATTSTAQRARTPQPESVRSPTPLRRGASVTLPAASVAVAVSAIARALAVAANLSSAVRLPYRSRATTRKTTVSCERSVRLPTTGVSPRSTTSASGGPGSTRTSTVRVSVSTLAVMVVAPARSPSVTRTRTTPDVSLSAALGVTVPPPLLVVIVTGCPTNGAPAVSRTSSTSG